jgi:limonene-1,2-epoxide hydrolase
MKTSDVGEDMTPTPMAAVNAHMAAINTKQRDQFVQTMAFPFVHMQPNGDKIWWPTADDVPDMTAMPFSRSEIQSIEILATSGDLTVYSLRFQRYDDQDEPALLVQGLWGVYRGDDGWKVGWRQYLGEV